MPKEISSDTDSLDISRQKLRSCRPTPSPAPLRTEQNDDEERMRGGGVAPAIGSQQMH